MIFFMACGDSNDTASLEKSLAVPYKIKYIYVPYDAAISLPFTPREIKGK